MDNYSLADIKAVTEGSEGFGGAWWIIILFLFFLNGGNGMFGNNSPQAQEILYNQQFDRLAAQLTSISNGLCDSTFSLNNSILTEGRAIQTQLANCCCETQRAIDGVKFENAQNTQKILDAICGNRMADMQNQINALQLQAALCGVVRYPNATTYTAGFSPFCGCGNTCPSI